jgi:pyridoxal phosphate enzyme (YggS family)
VNELNRVDRLLELSANLQEVEERIDQSLSTVGRNRSEVTLIVVTKNFPVSDCQILYELGIRNFGENRDQEGALKAAQMGNDLAWHFQGQIQSRKIRSIAHWAQVIHSLDSLEHAQKFDSLFASGESAGPRDFFVQVNLEPDRVDRGGIAVDQIPHFFEGLGSLPSISSIGLMAVAPLGMSPDRAFDHLRTAKERHQKDYPQLVSLSMGMSGDFESAIAAGATHIRIGSSILGSRPVPA